MRMKFAISAIFFLLPTSVFADATFDAFKSGSQCFLRFSGNAPACIGTIQRTVVYSVQNRSFNQEHLVYGKICDRHEYQESAGLSTPAEALDTSSKIGINIWGALFTVNETGQVSSEQYGDNIGSFACIE